MMLGFAFLVLLMYEYGKGDMGGATGICMAMEQYQGYEFEILS